MTNETMRERIGATRGKLALIGVLAVVLVVVIVVQLPESTNRRVPTASLSSLPGMETAANDGAKSDKVTSPIEKNPIETTPREWPELSMDAIIASDPLKAPSWYLAATRVEQPEQPNEQDDPTLVSAEDDARATALAELQQAGATIVLIANGERIATIGDQRIRIGDNIKGYQVSDITDQGVVLTRPKPR
jgi:hypothetical protein